MIRANVYSIEPLPRMPRRAISYGIRSVAKLLGEKVEVTERRVRLPLDDRGNVNPARVGFGKLDPLVELHVMAVPLDSGQDERIGLASVGKGVVFVNISKHNRDILITITAHEIAHALGFVLPDSEQASPQSRHHCSDNDCIMSPVVQIAVSESDPNRYGQVGQWGFCRLCKNDLRHKAGPQLARLRHERLFEWKAKV